MRSAYESADVVLNTSFAEGLSNAILEAIAAGRPVLASDIPGNRGPVRGLNGDRPAGLLFDPRNPEDFVGQALRLIDDPEERAALGQDGQARAARWPAAEDEADGLIRAYEIGLSKNKMQGFSGSRVRRLKGT